jgi:hypothetical protein
MLGSSKKLIICSYKTLGQAYNDRKGTPDETEFLNVNLTAL